MAEIVPMLIQSIVFDRKASEDTAVICADTGLSFSYADVARLAEQFAWMLRCAGLKSSDRVAILLPGSIEFVSALFGILRASAVAAPIDLYMKREEMLSLLGVIRPQVLVTNQSLFRKIRAEVDGLNVCLLGYNDTLSVSFAVSGLPEMGAGGTRIELDSPRPCPSEDAVLIMSSGSTGIPKAVRLSHRAIANNIRMHLESLHIDERIRGLQLLPMNFSYGLVASFLSILYSGGTAVIYPYIEPGPVLATIRKYDINVFMGTPALFQYLLEKGGHENDFGASPLRYLTIGGDRCKRYVTDLIRRRIPAAKVFITYGLSETGPRVSTLPHEFVDELPHSVGRPLNGVEVSILDPDGCNCPPYETGEIVVSTVSLMNGYFADPERTKRAIRGGRCYTGDIGYLDERGFLYISGRNDCQFKFGGRKVNPAFIEQCICSHPSVQEVSVTKIDTERHEVLRAFIRAGDTRGATLLDELKRLCRKHMPAYMVPAEFVFQDGDLYYHKGKVFNPIKEELPAGTSCGAASPQNALHDGKESKTGLN